MARAAEMRSGFEPVEHTADVGIRARGTSLSDLFEQAARGMIGLMLDPQRVRPASTRAISARAEQPDELLVAWLSEILFAFDGLGFAPASASVKLLGPHDVSGELSGEDFDPKRHRPRHGIKAVTYHDLAIKKVGDLYEVTIIFDV